MKLKVNKDKLIFFLIGNIGSDGFYQNHKFLSYLSKTESLVFQSSNRANLILSLIFVSIQDKLRKHAAIQNV